MSAESTSKWSCQTCTFENHIDLQYCEICGESRSKQSLPINVPLPPPISQKNANTNNASPQSAHKNTREVDTQQVELDSVDNKENNINSVYFKLREMGYDHSSCSEAVLRHPDDIANAVTFVMSYIDKKLAISLQTNDVKGHVLSLHKKSNKGRKRKKYKHRHEKQRDSRNNKRQNRKRRQYRDYREYKRYSNYSNGSKRRKLNEEYIHFHHDNIQLNSDNVNARTVCIKSIPPRYNRRSLRAEIEDTYNVLIEKCDDVIRDDSLPPFLMCNRLELKTINDRNKLLKLCEECRLRLGSAIISATPYIKDKQAKVTDNKVNPNQEDGKLKDNNEIIYVQIKREQMNNIDDSSIQMPLLEASDERGNVEIELGRGDKEEDVRVDDDVRIKKEIILEHIQMEQDDEKMDEENNEEVTFQKERISEVIDGNSNIDLVNADKFGFWVKFCPKCKAQFNRTEKDMKERCHEMICRNCETDGEYTIWCWECNQLIDPKRKGLIACNNCRKIARNNRNCKR